jgi:mannose-6-phosphate isomerase
MIESLKPNRVRRSYLGGGRIDEFTGASADVSDGVPRPEDWLASTVTAFNGSKEIEGEGLGRVGDGRFVKDSVGELPILVKLLDSDERLVIQAHPTVECARRLFGSPVGKTECWYFLPGTAPNACVYLGFKPGVTREKWMRAVRDGDSLLPYLHCVPVVAGDFVFVAGGMPHAIGAGCFMVELQEPSDLMVVAERFTPSGRRIPDAKMHGGVGWDRMFDVYEYKGLEYGELCRRYVKTQRTSRETFCICGPEFTDKFEMWRVSGGGAVHLDGMKAVAVVMGGEGLLNGVKVRAGDRLLVSDVNVLSATGAVHAIVCFGR